MQQSAFQNTANMAQQFGMQAPDNTRFGMPIPTVQNGIAGYSSGTLYDQALAELEARRPGQKAAIDAQFIDPVTGAMSQYDQGIITDTLIKGAVHPIVAKLLSSGEYGASDSTPVSAQEAYMNARALSEMVRDYPAWAPGGILGKIGVSLSNMAIDNYEAKDGFLGEKRTDAVGNPIRQNYYDYQTNLGQDSGWTGFNTSGPDISYSADRDFTSTTGYDFNKD
jgi:hypothetical protein